MKVYGFLQEEASWRQVLLDLSGSLGNESGTDTSVKGNKPGGDCANTLDLERAGVEQSHLGCLVSAS